MLFRSMVIRETNVVNVRYANQSVQGAVMVVPHDAFVGSRRVSEVAIVVPHDQIMRATVVGPTAQFAPVRASVISPFSSATRKPTDRLNSGDLRRCSAHEFEWDAVLLPSVPEYIRWISSSCSTPSGYLRFHSHTAPVCPGREKRAAPARSPLRIVSTLPPRLENGSGRVHSGPTG